MKTPRYACPELVLLNEAFVPEASVQNCARISVGLKIGDLFTTGNPEIKWT